MAKKVTQSKEDMLLVGKRLRSYRRELELTQEELIERIESLPENGGKKRSEKQIGYIERGMRSLSAEYAELIAKALGVRREYLLLEDDYETEESRDAQIAQERWDEMNGILLLMKRCGYIISTVEINGSVQRVITPKHEKTKAYFLEDGDFREMLSDIQEFVDFTCQKHIKRLQRKEEQNG